MSSSITKIVQELDESSGTAKEKVFGFAAVDEATSPAGQGIGGTRCLVHYTKKGWA